MRFRLNLVAGTAIITVAASFVPLCPAQAGHSGDANSGTPDNKNHCVDRNSVTTKVDDAVHHGISQLDRSDMDASLSCSGDVEVYDSYYGTSGDWNDVYGKTNCENWTLFYVHCDIYRVRYNLTYFAGYSSGRVDSGGCHEFGHTAGLGHRTDANDDYNNSCMWSEISATRPNFDSHDLDAINQEVA